MSASAGSQDPSTGRSTARAAQIVVVSSVMFTFISYWRTAAVVLCDMSSTVYYIGAIVENAIGQAAPWFILAVLLVQLRDAGRVHRELLAVRPRRRVPRRQGSAGRIPAPRRPSRRCCSTTCSPGRSAASRPGQYIVGLVLETLARLVGFEFDESTRRRDQDAGARWPSPAPSRSTSCARTCSASTSRAARR